MNTRLFCHEHGYRKKAPHWGGAFKLLHNASIPVQMIQR
jgi:hypothetical protein